MRMFQNFKMNNLTWKLIKNHISIYSEDINCRTYFKDKPKNIEEFGVSFCYIIMS